mgnify:CR=1 FL=1
MVYRSINSYRGNGGGELLTKGAGIPKDSLDSRIIYRSERDQRYYLMEAIEKMDTIEAKATTTGSLYQRHGPSLPLSATISCFSARRNKQLKTLP